MMVCYKGPVINYKEGGGVQSRREASQVLTLQKEEGQKVLAMLKGFGVTKTCEIVLTQV